MRGKADTDRCAEADESGMSLGLRLSITPFAPDAGQEKTQAENQDRKNMVSRGLARIRRELSCLSET
jgi:hypothetical protein